MWVIRAASQTLLSLHKGTFSSPAIHYTGGAGDATHRRVLFSGDRPREGYQRKRSWRNRHTDVPLPLSSVRPSCKTA